VATVLLYAQAREAAGTNRIETVGSTVGEILEALILTHPAVERVLPHCKIWVNGEPAELTDVVRDADEVALLPPVSGGA
jgi:molybdopterin converting factor small subunit